MLCGLGSVVSGKVLSWARVFLGSFGRIVVLSVKFVIIVVKVWGGVCLIFCELFFCYG